MSINLRAESVRFLNNLNQVFYRKDPNQRNDLFMHWTLLLFMKMLRKTRTNVKIFSEFPSICCNKAIIHYDFKRLKISHKSYGLLLRHFWSLKAFKMKKSYLFGLTWGRETDWIFSLGELSLLLIIELIYFIVLLAGKYDRFYPLRELKGMSF